MATGSETGPDPVEQGDASAFGFLGILKPCGISSHDLVAYARRILGIRRVGHTGTLDPAAAGVMVLAVGKATRLISLLPSDKAYVAELCFGVATDTADAEGVPVASASAAGLDVARVEHALAQFCGVIEQRPPLTSAVHVRGRRLYEWAREGSSLPETDIPVRRVAIHALRLLSFTPGETAIARLYIRCAAGTYIRSLAVDIGNALGLPACLTFLLRTEANGVGIDATQTVEAFTAVPGWLPHAMLLAHLPELVISVEQIRDIRLGRRIVGGELPLTRAYDDQGKLVAVLKSVDRMYQPTLVF